MFVGIWDEEREKAPIVEWARNAFKALEPWAKGAYVNLSDVQDEASLMKTYGPEKYARLQRIKAKYDPENVFCLNQNIKPKA
jgi:FAD/FMN-containing dehydrogenase